MSHYTINETKDELDPGQAPAHKNLAGDHKDDDGQYIDQRLVDSHEPVPPQVSPVASRPQLAMPAQATRVLTGRIRVDNTFAPFPLLTRDPNRLHVRVQTESDGQSPAQRRSGIPLDATATSAAGSGAGTVATATGIAGYRFYLTGLELTWDNQASADSIIALSMTSGTFSGATQSPYLIGIESGLPGIFVVNLPDPIPAATAGSSFQVSYTAPGATGPGIRLVIHGFYLSVTNPGNSVRLSDSSQTVSSAPFINGFWQNDYHTGDVWVMAETLAEPIYVSYWAVTR